MLETTFSKSNFDARVNEWVGDFVPAELITEVIEFMDARREFILNEISQPLTADSGLPLSGGYPRTTQDTVGLAGDFALADTRSVTVNGQLADFEAFEGNWTFGNPIGTTERFIERPHVWQYLDAGQVPSTAPGMDWRIDDPGWVDAGLSPLGYGDGGLGTEVDFIDTDPDDGGNQRNITTYFRTTFDATNVDQLQSLNLELVRDDGAVIYLNGVEAARSNMPEGDIDDETRAASTIGGGSESQVNDISIDPSLLVEGENVIAVEIHQRSPSSSDIRFDLGVVGVRSSSGGPGGIGLVPGINRITVESFDQPDGTGNRLDSTVIDIWYDDGDTIEVAGDITTDTTWTSAAGPYVVTSDLNVTAGTLTIQPGTSILFNDGAGLTVRDGGRIVAEGAKFNRIRFSHNPLEGSGRWDGLTLLDTQTDNRFRYADFSSGDDQGNANYIENARALFDYVSWSNINNQVLDLIHPTLMVRNSDIPGINGDETIHLVGLDPGEQLVFDNNVIGKNTSGGDVVDMAPDSLERQTIYFLNNEFQGGFDDGVDTDGTRTVFENNSFVDFHLNTSRTTTSNAISSGHQNVGSTTLSSELTIRNNTFYDVDHAVLLKDFAFAEITNNTIVRATVGGIQFQELNGSNVLGPGRGAELDGNIFWETPLIFEALHPTTEYRLRRSIVNEELVNDGFENLTSDPLLADPANGDFRLLEGSPAFRAGPNQSDIGAVQAPRYTPATADNLRITELHYNPVGGSDAPLTCEVDADGDLFEFIELLNPTSNTIDLSHVRFTNGIDYAFTWGATLAPGERVVLVKNQDIFESRYATGINIAGEFNSNLSNSGESIEVLAADGSVIAEFEYGDANVAGWPDLADGDGPSLEVIDIDGNYNNPANWRNGVNPGGTPGEQEFGPFVQSSLHRFQTDDGIELQFSEEIDLTTMAASDFTLTNRTTGQSLTPGNQFVLTNTTSNGLTVEFASIDLATNGDWRLSMDPGSFGNDLGQLSLTTYDFDFFILKGDYNRDRSVDAADFTVWQDTRGSSDDLRANGDNTGDSLGTIDTADLTVWQLNFGTTLGDPPADNSSELKPKPTTAGLRGSSQSNNSRYPDGRRPRAALRVIDAVE